MTGRLRMTLAVSIACVGRQARATFWRGSVFPFHWPGPNYRGTCETCAERQL